MQALRQTRGMLLVQEADSDSLLQSVSLQIRIRGEALKP